MADHNVYISHAWGGESEEIVQEIYKRCRAEGLNIILDRKDLGYRESITSFMHELGRADAIILVVSNKYLHSEYCMFELLQIYENKNIIHRIFPVLLDEVSIAKSTERLDLVKYWEKETESLETKIRELKNLSYIEGITDDLNLYQKIRNNIANLTKILKDINTLNIRLHKEHDYQHLIESIKSYLAKAEVERGSSGTSSLGQSSSNTFREYPGQETNPSPMDEVDSSSGTDQGKKWWRKVFLVVPLFLLIPAALMWWILKEENNSSETSPPKSMQTDGELRQTSLIENPIKELKPKPPEDKNSSGSISAESHDPASSRTLPGDPLAQKDELEPTSGVALGAVEGDSESTRSVQNDRSDNEVVTVDTALVQVVSPEKVDTRRRDLAPEKEEVAYRMEEVYVPSSEITVRVFEDISSNRVIDGGVVYLQTLAPFSVQGHQIVDRDARVRAAVIDAKPSRQGGRASLGIRLEAVETVDGQWLALSYHDIIDRRRGEIVFEAGTVFENVEINPATINLKVNVE